MTTRTSKARPAGERARFDGLGLFAFVADTALNAGGMWAAILQLDSTESYKMFATALQLGDDMRMLPALLLALALGAALAWAPQKLWQDPDAEGFMTRRRAAAVVAQLGGWYTTWAFLAAMLGASLMTFGVSVALEWLMVELKRGLFRGA
jgi:hypothetical protein